MYITNKELIKYLENWIKYPNENLNKPVIPFIHGQAGIGKTEILYELAKKHNKELVILNLSHQEEGDLIGIPNKKTEETEDGKVITYTEWAEPEWLNKNKNKDVILFLDEIDRAPVNILNAILTLLREYRIHTHNIPKHWKIIAAGNSMPDFLNNENNYYEVNELDNALKTRFVHLYYRLNVSEWLEWARNKNINPIILKYIESYPNFLIKEDNSDNDFSYPNPRTWELLSLNLEFINDPETVKYVAIGTLGKEVGTDFYVFYKKYFKNNEIEFLTFNDIINDYSKFKKYLNNKQIIKNTIVNIANNIEEILKSYDTDLLSKIFTKIIYNLYEKRYFELIYLLINSIETHNQEVISRIILLFERNGKEQVIKILRKKFN